MRKLLALCLAAPALVATSTPAEAATGVRVCTVSSLLGQTSTWTFSRTSLVGGSWSHSIGGRICVGVGGAPAQVSYGGTYLGNPCVEATLTGDAVGTVVGGLTAETTAVHPTFVVQNHSVFESGLPCNVSGSNSFAAETVQVHVIVT